jgi:hypothetical protein
MHWEGYSETGLLVAGNDYESFIEAYNSAHPDNTYEDLVEDNPNLRLLYPDSDETFGAAILDDYSFEGLSILPLSEGGWYPAELPALLIYADKSSAATQIFKHGFYSSADEMVEEFKAKCSSYLPEDFDYESFIGDITYALYA